MKYFSENWKRNKIIQFFIIGCTGDNSFTEEVRNDLYEARQVGVKGVPFFVFDRKYAISGAQDISVFEKTLSKTYEEWAIANA